jgi:hypothetical protein
VPLIAERLASNVGVLRDRLANVPIEGGYAAPELYGNTSNKLASMASVSNASREEETSSETLLLEISAGDSAWNRRLSCAG